MLVFYLTHLLLLIPGIASGGYLTEPGVPSFVQEPPNRIDFLNELGVKIPCQVAALPGFTPPQIQWLGQDSKIITNVPTYRTVLANGTLYLHPFVPAAYRQDLHTTTYRCVAISSAGTLRSRDVHVRAVVAQQWVVRVSTEPAQPSLSQRKSPVLIKCEIDFIGGGRNFVEVIGWRWDQYHFPTKPHSVSGERGGRYHLLPNGDLIVDRLQPEDARAKIICFTRHKLTRQEIQSPPFSFTFSESTLEPPSPTLLERYPDPVIVEDGEPVILHCVGGYISSSVRWEKFNGGSWLELVNFSMDRSFIKVGNSLVILRSSKAHSGQYRCSYPSSVGSNDVNHVEYHVRVSGEPLTVKVTINQDKSPLGASAEMVCTSSSELPVTITWYKDNNLINPGGRFRLLSNNILQISQIQREDQGIYQCFGKKERESAQSAVRLQLADSPPRLLLGFLDQTLGGPGPDISLRCVFHSGYPLPKISWTIDGFPPVPDPRIITGEHVTSHGDIISYYNISSTRVEDGGLYACTAKNPVTSARHSARLNIYGTPWVRVVPNVVAIGGEFLEIQCPASGYPIAGIGWEKDGMKLPVSQRQRVGSNGTLTITSVERTSDGGTYTCSAWDSQGRTARRDIQVNVVAPLRIAPNFPEKSKVVEDERVTLVCSLSSGLGTLKWTKFSASHHHADDQEQESPFTVLDTAGFTSLLSIESVKPSHAGTYTCTASDDISTVTRSHDLTVLVPVKIEPFSFQEGLREGARSRLVCGVTQGDLPITFSFHKDGQPLLQESGGDVTVKIANISITSLDPWSKVLQFSHLTSLHTGQYTCLASNPASQTSYTAKLLVQVRPKWIHEPVDTSVSRGEETRLDCFGEGVPSPTISWYKSTGDGLDIKWRPVQTLWPAGNVQSLHNGSLVFLEAEEHHEGQYMCKLENGIGPGESKIVHLDVNVPPYFIKTLDRQSVSQGKSHEVTCEVHGDSPMTVAWLKGGIIVDSVPANRLYTAVHREGKKTRVTLVMKNLDPLLDKGIYHCVANNSLGKVSQSFELWVEEKPNPPEDLRSGGIGARHVVLEWAPPLLPPSPGLEEIHPPSPVLTYIIEYSLVGDKSSFPIQRLDVLGESTAVKVESLSPSTLYSFRVAAVNSAGSGPPAELVVRTLSAPPANAPGNVRARAVANKGVIITWTPIAAEMVYGMILGYRIFFTWSHQGNEVSSALTVPLDAVTKSLMGTHNDTGKSNSDADDSRRNNGDNGSCCHFILYGLLPYTQYEIRLSGLNNAGEGPSTSAVLVRTLEHVPGSVRLPNCIRLSSVSLQLSWQPPVVSNGLVNSYKIAYFPVTSSVTRFPEVHQTSGVSTVLSGLQPYTNYSIHISAVNNAGESKEWTALFCKTLEDAPAAPVDFIGHTSSENSVYLNWLPPRRPNGLITHYTVYFRIVDGNTDSFESKRKVPPISTSYLEGQLDLGRHKYVFWVTASNVKGESVPSTQIIFMPPPIVEPRLSGQSQTIEVHEGESATLHCGLLGLPSSSSVANTSVRWISGGGKAITMSGNSFIKHSGADLLFVAARRADSGNYTCHPDDPVRKLVPGAVTYRLKVKGIPAVPHVEYRLENRDVVIQWNVVESKDRTDSPVGFILFYRSLGSIQEWKTIDLLAAVRNYTLKNLPCGAIVNVYMTAYNDVGTSGDSAQISVHVMHKIAPIPLQSHFLLINSTSVRLNLYPLNSNDSYCPTTSFSISIRESHPSEWQPGKEDRIPFANEHIVGGLKEATSYELLVTTYGYSSSKNILYRFVTLDRYGELPAVDVTTKHMVRDYSPFYSNLTLIIPAIVAVLAVIAALASVLAYCKTRRVVDHMSNLGRHTRPLPPFEPAQDLKGNFPYREQLYSTLPCPPYHPSAVVGTTRLEGGGNMFPEMEDISPYATFQLADPMNKFHEEGFSQDIVVPKFYDVMQQQTYSLRRGVGASGDSNTKKRGMSRTSNIYEDKWSAHRQSLQSGAGEAEEEEEDDEDEEEEEETGDESEFGRGFQSIMSASGTMKDTMSRSMKQQHHRPVQHPPAHLLHNIPRNPSSFGAPDSSSAGGHVTSTHSQHPKSSHLHQQRGYLSMDIDSSSPDPSPPHSKSKNRRASAEGNIKKVSGGTLERSRRGKETGRGRGAVGQQQQQQQMNEPGKSRPTSTGPYGGGIEENGGVNMGGGRKTPMRSQINQQKHESDYSIAV